MVRVNKKVMRNKITNDDMKAIYASLKEDIHLAWPAWNFENPSEKVPPLNLMSQAQRRTFIRALFAFVEGTSYTLRQKLLSEKSAELDSSVLLALDEKQLEVSGDGGVHLRAMKVSLVHLLKFTVRQYVSCFQKCSPVVCEGRGFESLIASVRTRDRLMHPRAVTDIHVSDTEIEKAIEGAIWYRDAFLKMLVGLVLELEHQVSVLRKQKMALDVELEQLTKKVQLPLE